MELPCRKAGEMKTGGNANTACFLDRMAIPKGSFILLVFLTSLLHQQVFSQFAVQYPAAAEPLTVCEGTGLLTLRIDIAADSSDNDTIFIYLPPGISYVAGSVLRTGGSTGLDIAEAGGSATSPRFVLTPARLYASEYIQFTIAREAGCAARFHALSGGKFKDIITVRGSAGTMTEDDTTQNTYNVQYPSISFNQPAAVINTVVGGHYNRSFTIQNGATGQADALHFYIRYTGGNLSLDSLWLVGYGRIYPHTQVGDTLFFTLSGAQLGPDNLFTNGELLQFQEYFKVMRCDATTHYLTGWGCGALPGDWCQSAAGSSIISMSTGVGNFSAFSSSLAPGHTDMCGTGSGGFVNYNAYYVWAGNGDSIAASAYSIRLRIGGNNASNNLSALHTIAYDFLGNVTINGVAVASNYTSGFLVMDLNNLLTTDPDGAGRGLEDVDGDGYFDDILPGDTVRIAYQALLNCDANCGTNILTNAGMAGDIRYTPMCGGTPITTQRRNGMSWTESGWTANGYAPANIVNGIPFRVRLSAAFGNNASPFRNANTRWRWQMVLPAGLSVSGTGNPTWTNGAYYNANTPSAVGYTQSNDTVFIQSPNHLEGWTEIDLVYDCALGGNVGELSLTYQIIQINDTTTGCICLGAMICPATLNMATLCPGSCSGGPVTYIPDIRRTDNSLGWTNASMTTRQIAGNINAFDLKKALYLDTIQIVGSARQYLASDSLGLRLELGQTAAPLTNKLTPLELYYEIWRGGLQLSSGTHTSFSLDSTAGGIQKIDWNLTPILPVGGLLDGDSIYTYSRYVVSASNLPTQDVQSGRYWYFYNIVDGLYVTCNRFVPEMYLSGTSRTNANNPSNMFSCNANAPGGLTNFLARRFGGAGRAFLDEFRPGFLVDSVVVIIPTGYTFVSANYNYTAAYGTGGFSQNLTPVSVIGNTYTFVNDGTWLPLGITVTNDYGATIPITMRPNCATLPAEPITYNVYIKDYYYALADRAVYPPEHRGNLLGKTENLIHSQKASLSLSDQTGPVQAYLPSHNWTVRLSNPSLVTAPYTWIAIPNKTGISITQVTDMFTLTPLVPIPYPGGVWYQISAVGLASGATADYRIDFTYSTCQPDSLAVLAGWNCGSFPIDPSAYICQASQVFLHFVPQISEVSLIEVSSPSGMIDLCTPASYEYLINCAQAGNTIDNLFNIIVPAGMRPLGDTIQAEYPAGAGNWTAITPSIAGNRFQYDLTVHPSYPSATGLPGTLSGASPEQRQIGVRFQVITDCDFIAGSSFTLNTTAMRPCGLPAIGNSLLVQSPPVNIFGITPAYYTSNNISVLQNLECNGSVHIGIETIVVAGSTGNYGKIYLTLPTGMHYVTGSLGCSSNPYCPSFNGVSILPGGNQRIELNIPSGIPSGTAMQYALEVHYSSQGQCGNNPVFLQTLDEFGSIACVTEPGGFCSSVDVQTGSSTGNINLNMPDFQFNSFDIATLPNGIGGETVSFSVTVINSGASMKTGQTAYINIYSDLNNNNIFDFGSDLFIGSLPFSGLNTSQSSICAATFQVPAYANTCRYFAIIDRELVDMITVCLCSRDDITGTPETDFPHARPDTTVCAGDWIRLGNASNPGYTYSWSPAAYLHDTSHAQPIFNATLSGTYTYHVTITRLFGCLATDTVNIDVFPAPIRTLTIKDISCYSAQDGSITISVTGGVPPYRYSIDNGITYPYVGPSPFTIENLTTGAYHVRVRDNNGCQTAPCH
ncbi:MAG: SprB repeat-containing protein [Lentimicrobiaceae bacterium]|nr:SprB repeat-containing protein [Lentimicrobiaceae bacterium]